MYFLSLIFGSRCSSPFHSLKDSIRYNTTIGSYHSRNRTLYLPMKYIYMYSFAIGIDVAYSDLISMSSLFSTILILSHMHGRCHTHICMQLSQAKGISKNTVVMYDFILVLKGWYMRLAHRTSYVHLVLSLLYSPSKCMKLSLYSIMYLFTLYLEKSALAVKTFVTVPFSGLTRKSQKASTWSNLEPLKSHNAKRDVKR